MPEDTRPYYVGFNFVKGIGATRLKLLIDYYGDIVRAWNAPQNSLVETGLSEKIIHNLIKTRSQLNLDEVMKRIKNSGITVITWDDIDRNLEINYPKNLRGIDQPPPVVYCKGEITDADEWAVAIVGTRNVTTYGRQVTDEISRILVRSGVTIVSGLAKGIDAIAHQVAVDEGGRTIAVLGSGVDRIYPPENSRIAEKITRQGAIISDYAPGTPPEAVNFPPRNRIISALAKAVIVIEADETSGALITATFAVEQGKELFAIPGNIHSRQSRGTNRLIQNGARLLMDGNEVLELLNLRQINNHRTARSVLPENPTETLLFSILDNQPKHIDQIGQIAKLPMDEISATLTIMELKGMVKQVGGMQFVIIRDSQGEYEI
jgi:DNA processing protein